MNRSSSVFFMGALALAFSTSSSAQDMAIKQNTAAEAKAFTDKVENELLLLANAASRADWVKATHILPTATTTSGMHTLRKASTTAPSSISRRASPSSV